MDRTRTEYPPDALSARCSSRRVLDLIADKWTVLVIYALSRGTRRHGELRRMIDGITQKMLTQTLRNLERDGFVERTVYPSVPPRVEYSLTPLGESLNVPLAAIKEWAEEHLDEVEACRAASADATPPGAQPR